MKCILRIAAALSLLLLGSALGRAESFPLPTLQEMLVSECIVVGRFVEEEGGALRFAPELVIRGGEDAVSRFAREAAGHFRTEEGPVFWSRAMAAHLVNDQTTVDPRERWIWFSLHGGEPEVQPAELADGYRALLEKKEPGLLFRLLQGLDPDMEWAATEELALGPDPSIVDRLHVLAVSGEKYGYLTLAALGVLQKTGLADGSRVPKAEAEPEPSRDRRKIPLDSLPPWTEADEVEFLLNRLTSHGEHGFVMESAARELVDHHFERGFAELRKRLRQDDVYNTDMVMDGIGYLKHPEVFGFLQGYLSNLSVGHRTFRPGLVALARQNSARSYDALREIVSIRYPHGMAPHHEDALRRALSLMSDPRAKAELARLGGAEPEPDLAELMAEVRKSWPRKTRNRWFSGRTFAPAMQNFAGDEHRRGALGEVARQDPAWLAGYALGRMGSEWREARQAAAEVFLQLTGRDFGYRAEALEGDRREPLEKLRAWWAENRGKSREEWLLSYFLEKGLPMERLWSPDAIPVLDRALEADFLTHRLAVEQISVITGKYFTFFPVWRSYAGREKMTIRVRAWLRFRGYVE